MKQIKKSLERWVDICSGKMTLNDLSREIDFYMNYKTPNNMIITIERDNDIKGYRSTIYLSKKDFKKPFK
jgi:hypothetical protein